MTNPMLGLAIAGGLFLAVLLALGILIGSGGLDRD